MSTSIVPNTPGAEKRLGQTIAAYEAAFGRLLRSDTRSTMQQLSRLLADDEPILTFCQAARKDSVRGPVLLVLTSSRLVVIDVRAGNVVERHPLAQIRLREWRKNLLSGSRMTLTTPDGERIFRQPLPADEGLRIAIALGFPDPWKRDLLGDLPADPGCPPIAYLGNLTLFPDRLVDHELRHLPFNGPVEATADTAGNIAVTRGRNLAAKAGGTMVFGPLGLFLAGNAKERATDSRELYLLVEGPGWAYTHQFAPDLGRAVRDFAATINITARSYWQGQDVAKARADPGTASEGVEELVQLAELHRAGTLTDAEFAAAKAKLLGL